MDLWVVSTTACSDTGRMWVRFSRATVEQEVQTVRAAAIFEDWVGEGEPDKDRGRAVRGQALL